LVFKGAHFKCAETRRTDWSRLIAEQEAIRQSVSAFCQERGIKKNSFYRWRKRLQENQPVGFALLEPKEEIAARASGLEVILTSGERLRVFNGVDAATLRLVLDAVRR
jgi:transposase-like protein